MNENENVQGLPEAPASRVMPRQNFFKTPLGIVAICVVGVLLAAVVAVGSVMAFYKGNYPGVAIDGISVGGKSAEETLAILKTEYDGREVDSVLPLNVNGEAHPIEIAQLGAEYDLEKTAEIANSIGRTGSVFTRVGSIFSSVFGGEEISCVVSAESDDVRIKMEEIIAKIGQEVVEPTYKIENEKLIVDRGESGLKIDSGELTGLVQTALEQGNLKPIEYTAEVTAQSPVDFNAILSALSLERRNASLDLSADPKGGVILPSQTGATFDVLEAQKVLDASTEQTVEIPATIETPSITTDDLKSKLFRDTLSSVSTKYNAGLVGRTKNVTLASQFINGTILNPGDTFSYNKEVGPRTYARGFMDATVFANGGTEDGVGGGICQVSSTLYLATLKADLQIVERRCHSLSVAYVPLGQDATVVYGSIDYRFKNNTDYPIKVVSSASGSTHTIKLVGTATQNKKVEMKTTVLSTDPFETITQDDSSLAPDKSTVKTGGYTGYKTATYRIVYVDGVEVSRKLENNSSYKRVDKVILKGPAAPPVAPPVTPPVEPPVTPPVEPPVTPPVVDPPVTPPTVPAP